MLLCQISNQNDLHGLDWALCDGPQIQVSYTKDADTEEKIETEQDNSYVNARSKSESVEVKKKLCKYCIVQ